MGVFCLLYSFLSPCLLTQDEGWGMTRVERSLPGELSLVMRSQAKEEAFWGRETALGTAL